MKQQSADPASALRKGVEPQRNSPLHKQASMPNRFGAAVAQPKTGGARPGNPALQKGRAVNQPPQHSCHSAGCGASHAAGRDFKQQPAAQQLMAGPKTVTSPAQNVKASTLAAAPRNSPAQVRSQQTIGAGRTQAAAGQPRGAAMQRFENLSPAGAKNGSASRPAASTPGKAADYMVRPPIPLGGGQQQIKVMIKGTQQVAGSVDISPASGGHVFISNLKVEQQYRRRGIANQLVNAAITNARQQGYSGARLEARPSDNGISPQALVSMYRRMGFKSVGKTGRGSPLMERRF